MPDFEGPSQSPNWETYKDLPQLPYGTGFHDNVPWERKLPGYPWRQKIGGAIFDVEFLIVPVWGGQIKAVIDDSREFMAQGTEWTIRDPYNGQIRNIPKQQVVAWCRLDS